MRCPRCGSFDIVYVGKDTYVCQVCKETIKEKMPVITPYDRLKAQVYATGNKWAIENFHATHD